MIRDEPPIGIIFTVICVSLFGLGWVISSETSETGNITQGRNQGIIFCSEKPKECAVECCGWGQDMVETVEFCSWCYDVAGQQPPEYDTSYKEDNSLSELIMTILNEDEE